MSTMKMSDLCKRMGLVSLCVVLLCAAIGIDQIIGGLAATGSDANSATPELFDFSDPDDLDKFEMWYAPTLTPEENYPAISVTDSVWQVDAQGTLKYKDDASLYHSANELRYNENNFAADFKIYNYKTHDWKAEPSNIFDHPAPGTYKAGNTKSEVSVKDGGTAAWAVKDSTAGPDIDGNKDPASDTVDSLEGGEGKSRNLGYLDFAPWISSSTGFSFNTGSTRAMTHKHVFANTDSFTVEVDLMVATTGKNRVLDKGVMIAPDGTFPFSNDATDDNPDHAANDTGLFITYYASASGNVRPIIIGAIDPSTAVAASGKVDTDKTKYPLKNDPMKNAANVIAAGTPIGVVTDDYWATDTVNAGEEPATGGKFSLAVEVKDGKVSVWNPYNEKANKLTVDLNENYAGGNVSLFATTNYHGAFAGFRLNSDLTNDATKKWDYSYSATRNASVHDWNPGTSTGTLVKDLPSTKQITYKSKDNNNANNDYGIAVLNAKEYGDFTLEMDVTGDVMVGFGANNTVTGVFPAQKNGGYAFSVKGSAAQLIRYNSPTELWYPIETGSISNYAIAANKYKVEYKNGTATLTVNDTQVISQNVGSGISGHIYLAANTEGTGIANLKVTSGTTDTYPLDKVQQMLDTFDFWYMPVGNATEEVPAYNLVDLDHAGNWYIDNSTMYFVEDHELFETAEALKAGVIKAQNTLEDKTVFYKSTDDEINYVGNYAIAMLKTPYTDFRLEVDVTATEYVPYIGFGAKGGHYGAHIGQADGGYAFLVRDYNQNNSAEPVTGITPQAIAKIVGFNKNFGAGQINLAVDENKQNKKITYDITKGHTYVIEVKDKKVTVKVDDIETLITADLGDYNGGYIYLASNNAATGFSGLKITDLSEVSEVGEEETAVPPADLSRTVKYSFSDDKVLDNFTSYYVRSTVFVGKPAIKVTEEHGVNWYLDNAGFLTYKSNTLQRTQAQLNDGVTDTIALEGGGSEEVEFKGNGNNSKWNSNFGVAMLKARTYENFIMDVDFRATTGHFYIGFGAKGGNYGIMPNTKDGGFALHFNQNGKDVNEIITQLEYNSGTAIKSAFKVTQAFDYGDPIHHIRVVVSDGVMYAFLDDSDTPLKATLPNYAGGYIYFGLNKHDTVKDGVGGFDNLQIIDLDTEKKIQMSTAGITAPTDVTIDRNAGEELVDYVVSGAMLDCEDVNGYSYSIPVSYNSKSYRSYIANTPHAFYLETAKSGWHNFELNGPEITFNVTNKPEDGIDLETTRKYYFDHINDLEDFMAYAPKLDKDGNPNIDGVLEKVNVFDKWTVTEDGKLVNLNGGWPGGYSQTLVASTQNTLLLKDLNLYDFHYQFDYEHLPRGATDVNYWYTYMIVGCQDPTAALRRAEKYTVEEDGETKEKYRLLFTSYTDSDSKFGKDPGIWFWVTLNRKDLDDDGPGKDWGAVSASMYYAGDVYAYEKRDFQSALVSGEEAIAYRTVYVEENLYKPHTIKVTMVNGQFAYQVDESPITYRDAQNEAIGGYIGLATHYHGSPIDNLTITALDEKGQPMKIADAKQGMAPAWRETTGGYEGWDSSEGEEYVWDSEIFDGVPTGEEE